MRILATLVLTVGLSLGITGVASADPSDDYDSCQFWWGSNHCDEQYTDRHIPSEGSVGPKGRDCATSWADHRRRGCAGQA